MKKISVLVLCLLVLCLCACQTEKNEGFSSIYHKDESSISENDLSESSLYPQEESSKTQNISSAIKEQGAVTKYQSNKKYKGISSGDFGYFYQNEQGYYYSDDYGFFRVDKKSGEHTLLDGGPLSVISVFEDTVYFARYDRSMCILDNKSLKFTQKSYEKLVEVEFDSLKNQSYAEMIENGWIVWLKDEESGTIRIYLTDSDFTTKKLLPIPNYSFVLDGEIFYLMNDGNVYCYNIETEKICYVTEFDSYESDNSLDYLGYGYAAVYGKGKMKVISLADGSVVKELSYNEEEIEEFLFDGKTLYLQNGTRDYEEAVGRCSIEAVSLYENKREIIYESEVYLPYYSLSMDAVDENYIYLCRWGHADEEENPTTQRLRINKDGSGEEVIYTHKGG